MTRHQAERAAWMAGSVGLIGVGDRLRSSAPAAFPHAWLAALTAWLGWPLGCMGLLLIHALDRRALGLCDPAAAGGGHDARCCCCCRR